MEELPYGARHLFESNYRLGNVDFVFEHDSESLLVIQEYKNKISKLIKPFHEVDKLLDSDRQWQQFCLDLIQSGRRFRRQAADREREIRSKVEKIRNEIGNTALELLNLLREYSNLASDEKDCYGYYYDVALDNLHLYLLKSADFHNQFYKEFGLVPCEYDLGFGDSLMRFINSQKGPCMPSTWAVVGAIANDFKNDSDLKQRRKGGDVLDFSQLTSKADFIRGLASLLKSGIERKDYPEKLIGLSFSSFTALAEVFHPFGGARADQVLYKDWTPKKDSAKDKSKRKK